MSQDADGQSSSNQTTEHAQEVAQNLGAGWLTLLVGPSFKLIGEHLAKKVDLYLNKNEEIVVREHIDCVTLDGIRNINDEKPPRMMFELIEWANHAKEFERSEFPFLNTAWREGLREILSEEAVLLGILPKFSEDLLRRLEKSDKIISPIERDIMKSSGLIEDTGRKFIEFRIGTRTFPFAAGGRNHFALAFIFVTGAIGSIMIIPDLAGMISEASGWGSGELEQIDEGDFGLGSPLFSLLSAIAIFIMILGISEGILKDVYARIFGRSGKYFQFTDKGVYVFKKIGIKIKREDQVSVA